MKKKILKFLKWLLLSLFVIFIGILAYFFKEIKTLDLMLRPEDKPFGSGLLQANKFGRLSEAIYSHDKETIEYLINEEGYDPNEIRVYNKKRGASFNLLKMYIMDFGENASSDFVRYLISKGFDADECEQGLSSPIYAAALVGNIEVAEVLLENGAKINCPYQTKGSPLTIALMAGKCEFAKYLVDKGASLDSLTCDDETKKEIQKRLDSCYK